MVTCIFVYSRYCPNCELFKEGMVEREVGGTLVRIHSLGKGYISAYSIIKSICTAVGIPCSSVDIGQDLGIYPDESLTRFIPILHKGNFVPKFYYPSNIRQFVREWLKEKEVVELPCFLIKSTITHDRFVNVEIRTDNPYIPMDWSAVRQVLRAIARSYIEEILIASGAKPTHEVVETVLKKLFPVNEVGEVDELRWIRSFIALKHLKVYP